MYRKRKRRGKGAGKIVAKVMRAMNVKKQQKRLIRVSTRNNGFQCLQNQAFLVPMIECGSVANMEAIMGTLVSAAYQRGLGINETDKFIATAGDFINEHGQIYNHTNARSQLQDDGVAAEADGYICKFSKYRTTCMIRNSELHPIDITLYECVAKTNRTENSLDIGVLEQLQADLFNGFLARSQIPTTSTETVKAGAGLYSNRSSVGDTPAGIDSFDLKVQPGHSSVFQKYWKIVKQKSYRLQPGDEINWRSPSINYTFSPKVLYNHDDEAIEIGNSENTLVIKGVTRVLMAKVSGVLGRSEDVGEHAVVGHLIAELVYKTECTASIVPGHVNTHGVLRLTTVNKDDLVTTSESLHAQSEHLNVTENPN